MAITPQQARAELARRELERRQQTQAQPTATPSPTGEPQDNRRFDQKVADFVQPLAEGAAKVDSAVPYVMGALNPMDYMVSKSIQNVNEASGELADPVAEYAGEKGMSGPASAALGMGASIAANPLTWLGPGEAAGLSSKLKPSIGKPGMAARFAEQATGVKASNFERLRRDPGAFFLGKSRQEAGQAIGDAKVNADVNLGVTNEPSSLTTANLKKARNVQAAGTQAENAVVGRIEKALESGDLDVIDTPYSQLKSGEPRALFSYSDEFGPGGSKRNVYDVVGDPNHPKVQKVGFGSSVPFEKLEEVGIPVAGRNPRSMKFERVSRSLPMDQLVEKANITADEVSTALEGINNRLSKIERTQGRQSPAFQKWATVKDHFQNMLETVAPEVKEANQAFSRVALRDEFMNAAPVNQSGTMSKIDAFGFTPAVVGAGAMIGGPIGAGLAYLGKTAYRSPFVRGAGVAARGLMDKVVDPVLSYTENRIATRGAATEQTTNPTDRDQIRREFVRRFVKVKH